MADADKWTYRNDDFAKDSGLLSYEESNSGKRPNPQFTIFRSVASYLCRAVTSQPGNPTKIRTFKIGSNTLKFTELSGFPDGRAMLKVP